MRVIEAIRTKRATRQFTGEPVPEDVIVQIVNAGRRSQSSKNTQPWRFVVVRDRATLEALSKTGTYAGHLAGAAFAVVLVGDEDTSSVNFDLGQASSYLQLAAWDLGVGSCIATIMDQDAGKAILGIPSEKYVRNAISFGYSAKEPTPASKTGRKPIDDIVRWETW